MPVPLLVADDDPAVRAIVCATVALDEYTVLEAADGDQAWTIIRRHRPTVALLDVIMPGLSGLELTRLIRADPDLAGTIVILLSARGSAEDVRSGLAAGADHYLTKPFSPLQLLSIIAPGGPSPG